MPKAIKKIIKECEKRQQKFTDSEFPPNSKSVGINVTYAWKRPEEFMSGPPEIFHDGISVEDIAQGKLGDCYFLGSLAALAEKPRRIKAFFRNHVPNPWGVFCVTFFFKGVETDIILDDYFPVDPTQNVPVFSRCNGPELWVLLLEKAYAKIHGSYAAIEGGNPGVALADLTGGPSYMYKFKEMDKDVLWKSLLYHDKNDNVMCCSVPEVKNADLQKEVGLIEGHAYSLLDVREYRGERLVHVRNPWGKTEWTGAWSDGDSAHWTPLARRALQYEDADDGSFWMPYSDWLRYFEVAVVNIVEEGWGVATEGVKLEARTSLVPFKLSEPCDVYLTARLPCDNFGIRACVVSKDVPHIPYGGTSDAYTGSAVVSADQRLRLPAGEFYVVIEAFPQHAQTMLPIDINVSLYCSDSSVSFLPRTPAEKTAASTCSFLIPSFEQKYGCCEACGCALGPAHMNIRGQHYHSTCLLCYYCGGQLGNSVFFKGDKLACKACAAKPRPPPYAGDELKRRVAERKSGGQKAYKEKCQRIFSGISGIFKLRIRFRKPRRDQLRAMFDSVDEDGDGEIPASELGPLIKALGCPEAKDPVVRDIQLRSIMARTDLNESGTVNFKELTRIMETDYLTTLNAVILKVDRAAEIFHSMEVGGTGVVPQAQPLYNAVSGEKLVGKSYKKFVKCVGESRVPFNTFIKFCIQFNSA